MLSTTDLQNIKKLIEVALDEKLDQKLEQKLNEKLANFPSKDEFFTKMDEVMGELQAMREENMVLSHHSSQHTDDIDKLKSLHPNFAH